MKCLVSSIYGKTEDHEKVVQAIMNIFPEAKLEVEDDIINGVSPNIDVLLKMINQQRIRDTARQVLHKGSFKNKIKFFLNKQVAYVSKVNFVDGNSVLGDIKVIIEIDDPEAMLDSILPTNKIDNNIKNKDKGLGD